MGLREYHRKRDFARTSEPRGKVGARSSRSYVIQKHAASRLHYDFRLENEGVLLSWAVPKGPSLDPADKRLAVQVEDHPTSYGGFEGVIPKGEYGGGSVLLWDNGTWTPSSDVADGLRNGKLEFELHGSKLRGAWKLIRLRDRNGEGDKNWLLIKRQDDAARRGGASIVEERPESVLSGRKIEAIAKNPRARTWSSKGAKPGSRVAAREQPVARERSAARERPAARRPTARRAEPALPGARRAELPGFVPLQLATLVDAAPDSAGWIHEVKYDGYRMLAQLDHGRVRWFSRNGLDWTARFTELTRSIAALPAQQALLDGEVVVLTKDGVSDFQRLQQTLGGEDPDALSFFAFDLLHLDGWDLRGCTLLDRKRALQALIGKVGKQSALHYSEHVDEGGASFLVAACEHALEGIISKRADGRYLAGRSREWTKAKCGERQEFVVVGYTKPQGSRVGLGALALAVHAGKQLRFAGRVGSGFDERTLAQLVKTLKRAHVDKPPFDEPLSAENRRGVQWVEPRLVVEIAFSSWTGDGLLRHPRFLGMREDKTPAEVVRESKAPTPGRRSTPAAETEVAGVRISHPDRVVDAASGVTKLDVARYYERVAPLLLPHVVDRPLSVLRCPDGIAGACFFQKHAGGMFSKAVKSIPLRDSGGDAQYLTVDSLEGLLGLVQMNVLELHPWGSRRDELEKPDRMFFDLDPSPELPWKRVVAAALQLRDVLARMGIDSFVKTTGGKGLHVVVPLARKHGWDEVKEYSRAIAFELARVEPGEYVAIAAKAARKGRIFVDYLRNARGATAVAPYSLRARANAPIAMPIAWRALEQLASGAESKLEHGVEWHKPAGRDPWAALATSPQTLSSNRALATAVRPAAPSLTARSGRSRRPRSRTPTASTAARPRRRHRAR